MKTKLRCLLFPLFLIASYEIFFMKIFLYSKDYYNYIIVSYAIVSIVGSMLSDKFSRKFFLYFNLITGLILFAFYYFGYIKLAIFLSPLFFSPPIARAALVDNHEHLSVKNLMCISYVVRFLPWCFYSFFLTKASDNIVFIILMLMVFSSFFFDIKKIDIEIKKVFKKKRIIKKKYILILFASAFLLAQTVYQLVGDVLGQTQHHAKLFDFVGIGLVLGSSFCFFLKEKHDELIFLSYGFLLLLSINVFASFFFWHEEEILKILLGELAIVGGLYTPLVTEKAVFNLGKNKRGFACGLIDFLKSLASLLSLLAIFMLKNYFQLLTTILAVVIIVCIFQGYCNHLSKKIQKIQS